MTIDEIYKREEISVRSYNICKYNKLNSISDLKKYYYENKTFRYLRYCGRRSNEELIDLCRRYPDNYDKNKEKLIREESLLKDIISNLTRVQREVINSFIFVNTNSLSVRSKNAICFYLKNNLKIRNFAKRILLPEDFNAHNIRNVGARSVAEIEGYISIIKDFVLEVNQTKNEKYLITLKNKFLIHRTFKIPLVPNQILESESIFQLTEFLLNQNAFFDENQMVIVKRTLKLFNDQIELSLDEIAEQVGLSRERVRQIRKFCLDELITKLHFISNFNDDLFQKYNIDVESKYIEINSESLNKINQSNNTNFSKEFITYIVSAYLNDSFSLIGNYEDVLQLKKINSRNRHNWKNFYLVEKKIATEIDFISLTNDISNRINERIEETYSFHFKSYLSKFLTKNNIDELDELLPICEKLINEEFEIYLDLEENMVFKRNTNKQVPEYIIEALDYLGKPSKLSEIYEWIDKNHPNATKNEEALRGSCQRSNKIIYFGRSSTYGLKKWEKTRDDIKGGTIKDIVYEFLEQKNTPIHINELLNEIHLYRQETNAKNVITNLKLDPQKQFIVYNQSFIGLNKMEYNSNLTSLPKFLGKQITKYIRLNNVDIDSLTLHFSNKLRISKENMSHILQQLIDNNFMYIDELNYCRYENKRN